MKNKPNIRDLLSDYFQSGNNDVNEQALFTELAQDSSLREELRLQKHLHNAVASDFEDIYVPAEVTASIFSKLGFYSKKRAVPVWGIAMLIVAVLSIATAAYYVSNSDTLNSSSIAISNAIVADNYADKVNNTPANADAANATNIADEIQTQNNVSSSADVSSNANANKSSAKNNSQNSNKNTKHSALIASNSNNNSNNNSNSKNGRSAKAFSSQGTQQNNNTANMVAVSKVGSDNNAIGYSGIVLSDDLLAVYGDVNNAAYANINKIPTHSFATFEPVNYSVPFVDDTKWSVGVNYFGNSQINTNSNIPSENANYANTSLSGAYRFSSNNAVGVEFGFQNFEQSFKINNGGLAYEQAPLFFYYGAYWKYSPDYLVMLDRVYPYMKILGGGTSSGPIVKGQVGTLLRVYSNIYLNAGVEYGTLFYNVENQLYHPQNIGITLGIQFNY